MSASTCIGFRAHAINPNRCRRCFKDISEHDNSNSNNKTKDKDAEVVRVSSTSDSSVTTKDDDNTATASFTLKPKKVKFSDDASTSTTTSTSLKIAKATIVDEPEPNVEFTVCVKKPRATSIQADISKSEDYQSRIKELSQELVKSKDKIESLEAKNKELENMRKSYAKSDQSSIKQNFDENIKLKQKIDDLEAQLRAAKSEPRRGTFLDSKMKTTTNSEATEFNTKLAQSEKQISALKEENAKLKKDYKALELEFQEIHDNFSDDHANEFRLIKREMDSATKNCRILQFKLKKAERTIELMEVEKVDMQKQMRDLYDTAHMNVDKRRMKELENELNIAKEVSLKLHSEIEVLKEERLLTLNKMQEMEQQQQQQQQTTKGNIPRGKLTPTPSFEQTTSNKDYEQVVRDLYDTMEREKDVQEQLKYAEEETKTMRKKLSTMEQENEILMMQIRKMTTTKNEGDDDSEELNLDEMKLHLELYEQEMTVLRRKTDEMEQENENFQQEIKYLQEKLISQPLAKVEVPEIPAGSPPNVIYEHKIRIIEAEARELRKKLVEREKENESLRMEVELHRRRSSKVISRSRSLDGEGQSLDTKKQLQLFEQEASILRQKVTTLENENEKLTNDNKRMQIRLSKKPPLGPTDQLHIENIELKDKIKELERKCDALKLDLMNSKLNESTETETDFLANLTKQLKLKETDLNNQATKLSQMDIELNRVNREYKKLKESLNPKRRPARVLRETATRLELKDIIKELEEEIQELFTNIRGKDVLVENLEEELSELKRAVGGGGGHSVESKAKFGQNKNDQSLETLQAENKELLIKLDDLTLDVEKAQSKVTDLEEKLKIKKDNEQSLSSINQKLKDNLERCEDEIEEMNKRLRGSDPEAQELRNKLKKLQEDLDTQIQRNKELAQQIEPNSRGSSVTSFKRNEAEEKLKTATKSIASLEKQLEDTKAEMKSKENKLKEEFGVKLETTVNKVRKEVHRELQALKEEGSTLKFRCSELNGKLERAEKEAKEAGDKLKTGQVQFKKERDEALERVRNLEYELKTEQRKRDKMEKELDNATRNKEEEVLEAQGKAVQLERDIRRLQAKLDDAEYNYNNKMNQNEKEMNKHKTELQSCLGRYDLLEKDFVELKSRSVSEKQTLVEAVESLKKSYESKLVELKKLKETSLSQQKEWYKEKLVYQERIASFEARLNKANLVEEERDRLKALIKDKENLLNSYRKEERSHNEDRERNRIKIEELQNKVTDLEKVERNTRFLSITGRAQVDKELQDYRIRLEHSETSHKGELAALHAEYEGRMRLLGEEVEHMQQQISMLAQERDRYRDSLERLTKDINTKGNLRGTMRGEVEELNSQLRTLRADLEGALVENRNLKIQHGTERTSWQIQVAEYKTQLNQMEERILLETRGATRNYARTKMELAWEKERQENQRILQETQKFIQELRAKLMDVEKLREKDRDEGKKQLVELKLGMDRDHVSTQQKVSELQFDLIALKEAHSKLKAQNDRLRNERAAQVKAKVDFIQEEIKYLQHFVEDKSKSSASKELLLDEMRTLQQRLKTRYDAIMQETTFFVSTSNLSLMPRHNGSQSSLSSAGLLPPPGSVKKAPPRLKLIKKSLSLDQQLGKQRGASQERIWDSDASLNSTPNSSISNLRGAYHYAHAGYESDSSGSSFFLPAGELRLRQQQQFRKEGSFVGSESDTSMASSSVEPQSKKLLKEKLKLAKKSAAVEEADKILKQKLTLQGFELSPLEVAKQKEKKEKSLRYKISKTLSKTFSRSTSTLPEVSNDKAETSKVRESRKKSPARTEDKEKPKIVPGLAQLRERPTYSNLAIPPTKQSPPKIRLRTETNV